MRAIGRLSEGADLVIAGERLGRAEFDIVVFQAGGKGHSARGKLNCDYNLLYRAFEGTDPHLVLRGGENLSFSVLEISPDGAEIEVNSDIPGF